ncbi:GntR family transcriptional regulator [Streptodolium elevatio]
MPEPLSGDLPAYQEIADRLRARIVGGALGAGARLPSEQELRTLYGSSRETVRKALAILKAEGLVVSQHGRGVFVQRRGRVRRSAADRYVRSAWHSGISAGQADLGDRGPELRADMVRVETLEADAATAGRVDLPAGSRVVRRERRYLQGDRPLQLAVSFLPADIAGGTRAAEPDSGPGGSWARLEEAGWRFTVVREEVESRIPTFDEATLLHMSPGSPLLVVHRIATGERLGETRVLDYSAISLPAELHVLVYESAVR